MAFLQTEVFFTAMQIFTFLIFLLAIAACIGYKVEKITRGEEIEMKRKIIFHQEKWNKKVYKINNRHNVYLETILKNMLRQDILLSKEEEKRLSIKVSKYNELIEKKEITEETMDIISGSIIKLQNELENGIFLETHNKEKESFFAKTNERMKELGIETGIGERNLVAALKYLRETGKEKEIRKVEKIAEDITKEEYDFLTEENKRALKQIKDDLGYYIVEYIEKEEKERKERYKERIKKELEDIENI